MDDTTTAGAAAPDDSPVAGAAAAVRERTGAPRGKRKRGRPKGASTRTPSEPPSPGAAARARLVGQSIDDVYPGLRAVDTD